jgi:hypothetical protein
VVLNQLEEKAMFEVKDYDNEVVQELKPLLKIPWCGFG